MRKYVDVKKRKTGMTVGQRSWQDALRKLRASRRQRQERADAYEVRLGEAAPAEMHRVQDHAARTKLDYGAEPYAASGASRTCFVARASCPRL
jgi:1,4-alpha-glucan branching enzyme